MATSVRERLLSADAGQRRPRPLVAVLFVTAVLVTSCGQGADPSLQSEAAGPIDVATTDGPDEAEASLSPEELAELEALSADASIAAKSAEGARLIQGRAATDPRAQGTIVAHATSQDVVAYREPDINAAPVASFVNPTATGGPLVFAASGRPVAGWIEVMLPIRPNGSTGWIRLSDVDLTTNPYRIEVNTSEHELTVYRYGRVQLSTTVAIGNGATPTPIGEFYLIELLRPSSPDGVYGPYAYGLSGYSETLESFNGGEGIIGIHGTNQPELLGQDVSHGCIRVANPTIAEMTEFLPLGTPVKIFRST